jgi:hypothetical protein
MLARTLELSNSQMFGATIDPLLFTTPSKIWNANNVAGEFLGAKNFAVARKPQRLPRRNVALLAA